MKKMLEYSIVILAAFLIVIPLAAAYENSANNFSIDPPEGWTTKENVQGVTVQFLGPADPDVGAVNINVDVQDTILSLDEVVSQTKQDWDSNLQSYTLISEGAVDVNGKQGYALEVAFEVDESVVMQDAVLIVEEGKLYQVNYIAGPTTYDSYVDAYIESVDTFEIKSPEGFDFSFELSGLPFILLVIAIVIVIVVIVIVVTRRNKSKTVTYPPPPPPT